MRARGRYRGRSASGGAVVPPEYHFIVTAARFPAEGEITKVGFSASGDIFGSLSVEADPLPSGEVFIYFYTNIGDNLIIGTNTTADGIFATTPILQINGVPTAYVPNGSELVVPDFGQLLIGNNYSIEISPS